MAIKIDVSIPGRELLARGSIALSHKYPTFEISIQELKFEFFFDSRLESTPRSESTMLSEKHAKINLIGFNNPLGTSFDMEGVSVIDGRPISIFLIVHDIGANKSHLVNYTITG